MEKSSLLQSIIHKEILARTNVGEGTEYSALKPKQIETLLAAINRDTVAVLPTGYGKTVIIQMLPYISVDPSLIVIVNPLSAIITEQRERFGERCITVDPTSINSLSNIDINNKKFIIGHPEYLVSDTVMRFFRDNKSTADKVSHIVVDEAHCILTWGKSKFREEFLKLRNLRVVLPNAKVLALTATANQAAQQEIIEALNMDHYRSTVVTASPDRPSVFMNVERRSPSTGGEHEQCDSFFEILDPLFEELQEKGISFPKTIVYLPLQWCGQAHHRALQKVGTTSDEVQMMQIAQYHAPQTSTMKTIITSQMKETKSMLRLLLATEAYGMGVDAPDVRRIIHIKPPTSMETYVQELGRAGRDGAAAEAILYFNMSDIASNVKHLQESMRQFCTISSCRRNHLLAYFGCSPSGNSGHHTCCDVCRATCRCSVCTDSSDECTRQNKVSPNIKTSRQLELTVHRMLVEYFKAENSLVLDHLFPEAMTGLTVQLAECVAKDAESFYRDGLDYRFPSLDSGYKDNIVAIISSAKEFQGLN